MRWQQAATVLLCTSLVAACAGPSVTAGTAPLGSISTPEASAAGPGAPSATSGSTGEPRPSPTTGATSAPPCLFDGRGAISLRAALASGDGIVIGLTTRGEVLVGQRAGNTAILSIYDPVTRAVRRVVARKDREIQVVNPTGNDDWVVWTEQRGFDLWAADWSVWSYNRHTMAVRKVAERVLTAAGDVPLTLQVVPSLAGNTVAWSANQEISLGHGAETTYAADLATGTVRPLVVGMAEMAWAHATTPDTVAAVMAERTDTYGMALAVPVTFDLETSAVTKLDWIPASRVSFFAASSTAAIAIVSRSENSGDNWTLVVDPRTNASRRIDLPGSMWPVAGAGFVAWSTEQDTLILPNGAAAPVVLASRRGANWVMAAGPWVAWWDGPSNATPTSFRGHITCPSS